jgi:RNA polymerase sigma-70 factor, ECF subfamily
MDASNIDASGITASRGPRASGALLRETPRPRTATTGGAQEKAGGPDVLQRRAIAAAKQGSWDGIHYLYARYADDVYAYVLSIVRDHHEAEDITQNVFTKLIKAIAKYEERAVPFAAWIMRVARNATLDHMRARRQIPVEEVRTSDLGDEHVDLERRQYLKEALASLPEEQRTVLVMRHVAGLSPPEIAERLGKTESSVHGLHHRGRAALKAALIELDAAPQTV